MTLGLQPQNTTLYDTPFLKFKSAQAPDGTPWFYAHRPHDGVVIVPWIHNKDGDRLAFIETKRPPLYAESKAQSCIEFPGGLVGDVFERRNETVLDAIKNELMEETGLMADKITIVAENVASSSGLTSETTTIAIADIKDATIHQKPVTDGGIIIGHHRISLPNVNQWLAEQRALDKAISGYVLSGLYFVATRIAEFKK